MVGVVVGVKATRRTFLALQKVLISAPTCRPAPATIVTWPLLIVSDILGDLNAGVLVEMNVVNNASGNLHIKKHVVVNNRGHEFGKDCRKFFHPRIAQRRWSSNDGESNAHDILKATMPNLFQC